MISEKELKKIRKNRFDWLQNRRNVYGYVLNVMLMMKQIQ
jgi:hypothetical protein